MGIAETDVIIAREFTLEELKSLVRRSGQFHEVVIGADKAVSIAKTKSAAARLSERASKLAVIANVLPTIGIPKVVAIQDNYLVMSKVPGKSFEELGISQDQKTSQHIAHALGDVLGKMKSVATDQLSHMGLKITRHDRWSNLAQRVEESLVPLMSISGQTRARREMDAASQIPRIATNLIHGDLGGTNILWSLQHGIPLVTGILDWDEAQIGDIAVDLAALKATFGPGTVQQIAQDINLNEDILQRVNVIQSTFALQQALAGYEDNDQDELDDGLREYI